jgi:predicted nucleic acid-binding protein
MKHVLIDTNIILDFALERKPFFKASTHIFDKINEKIIKGYVSASSITDIYYVLKKSHGHETTIKFIRELIYIIEVLSVSKKTIIDALNMRYKDFEDAVQSSVAEMNNIDIIVTRNKFDFTPSSIKVYTPDELIKKLAEFYS